MLSSRFFFSFTIIVFLHFIALIKFHDKNVSTRDLKFHVSLQNKINKKSNTKKKSLTNGNRPKKVSSTDSSQKGIYREAKIKTKNFAPEYPSEAIKKNLEGTVTYHIEISKEGELESIKLLKSSGHKVLDDSVLKAIRKVEFSPALSNGSPIKSFKKLTFPFQLVD